LTEKHRRMWLRWLAEHCEGCGFAQKRAELLGGQCHGPDCTLKVTAVDPQNLLPHLETAWMAGKGPSERVQGPAWTLLRHTAAEFRALGDDGTGFENLDESLTAVVKGLVEAGG
jgi:hypothetical protein